MNFDNRKFSVLFFDLDRTLWDFDSNSIQALALIYSSFNLKFIGASADDFITVYRRINDELWDLYRKGEIDKHYLKKQRFIQTFQFFDVDNESLALEISEQYYRLTTDNVILYPGATDVLSYLSGKYRLAIITNGFEEVQKKKLKVSGLDMYFEHLITSESVGISKPQFGIFEYALCKMNVSAENSMMIGDDPYVDLEIAQSSGITDVWFNPNRLKKDFKATIEINHLSQLKNYL